MRTREEVRLIRFRRLRRDLRSQLRTADLKERNEKARERLLARIRRQAVVIEGDLERPRETSGKAASI